MGTTAGPPFPTWFRLITAKILSPREDQSASLITLFALTPHRTDTSHNPRRGVSARKPEQHIYLKNNTYFQEKKKRARGTRTGVMSIKKHTPPHRALRIRGSESTVGYYCTLCVQASADATAAAAAITCVTVTVVLCCWCYQVRIL